MNFHGMCVKLAKADLAVIKSSVNIVWFCEACKRNVLPVQDGSGEEPTEDAEQRDAEETGVTDKPESRPISEEKEMEPFEESSKVSDGSSTENGEQDISTAEEGNANNEDSQMKEVKDKPELSEGEIEPSVELSEVSNNSSTENTEQDVSTAEEGNANDDDSQMQDLQNNRDSLVQATPDVPAGVEAQVADATRNDQRSPDSSSNPAGNSDARDPSTKEKIAVPVVRTSTPKVFTFGESEQPSPSDDETADFSFANPQDIAEKFKEIRANLAEQNNRLASLKLKLETDENNNEPPASKKLLLGNGSTVPSSAASKTKFSLFVRFSVPNMSDWEAEAAVRDALGMSRRDPVTAWSVTPHHVSFPRFSTFRVDVDARWKLAALSGSSWRATSNLLEHREWYEKKL